ncbi:MAG: autotransporter-associated beta strand repeat-containing protein [Bacteroidaceae bacterium]|nr:autotransporter-associated beta strand repeat-containing protein [Bacteroidaceae bacterium]
MQNRLWVRWAGCLIGMLLAAGQMEAQQLAFPGACGWGRFATGGRGGSVYHVTNLNDSGSGSLRDAVSQPNRIVVFDVAGVIQISSRMVFAKNLYVAGQTAPGEGIVVYGDGVSFSGSDNIIVRYVRFRMGKGGSSGKDAAGVANGTNMIFDHCSFSWGLDETFSINWDNKGTAPSDITISNCLIGQGLLTHSAGGLIQADRISLYRNLYCDNDTRNNKIKGINQYVNCLVYNWRSGCYLMGGDSEGTSYSNATNNLFINGPAGGGNAMTGANDRYHIYAADNWQDRNANGTFDPYEIPHNEYSGGPTFHSQPFDYPTLPAWQACQLVDSLLPKVGASLPYRDLADAYMVHQVRSMGTEGGIISSEAQLPIGVPSAWNLQQFSKPADSDADGMPDAWEKDNGLDATKNDAMEIADNGYANIENYVNSLTADNRTPFLRSPVLFSALSATDHSVTLTWYDFTEGHDGFALERMVGSTWTEVARTQRGAESLTLQDLEEGSSYQVRLRAFRGDDLFSEYTPVLTVKTQPKQVEMIDVNNYVPDLTWLQTDGQWDFSTPNWDGELYANGKQILVAPQTDAELTLNETVEPAAVVVNSPAAVSLKGTGTIGGTTSVNKAGEGTFAVETSNTYTGATVLHGGTFAFSSLKDGEQPSAIGASSEFGQNWIWDGGVWNYTGGSTQTNRSANLYADTEFDVQNSSATVTMKGTVSGSGSLTLGGKGKVQVASPAFFAYDGATIVRGGTLHLPYLSTLADKKVTLGQSSKLVLAGGAFTTKDANDNYSVYEMPIEAMEGTTSVFEPYRNCYIKSAFSGSGTIDFRISWVREYLQGNMTDFYGRLIGNGVGTSNQLVLDTKTGIPNGVVQLKGTIMMIYWQTNGDLKIGGLSGASTSTLGGSSKQTAGHKMTWRVGGANTDETFAGVINDCASNTADKYKGTTTIVKEGTGDWRLTGTNTYTGTTTVEGGRLVVNGTHNTGGAYVVRDGATLMGRGTVGAKVTVQNGGTLCAGDTLVSSSYTLKLTKGLTLNSGAVVEVPVALKNGTVANNRIAVTGAMAVGGATLLLNLDKAPELPNGAVITVFSKLGTVSGAGFDTILPERPSEEQEWDTSTLLTDGKIRVVAKVPDGVEEVSQEPSKDKEEESTWYNLDGHRTLNPSAGIYINRGKKVVVKKGQK